MIRIYCPQDKFRRGGVEHPKGEAFYREDHFTEKALAAIEAEPKLAVTKGLEPTGLDMMSVPELQDAIEETGCKLGGHENHAALMGILVAQQAEKKAGKNEKKAGK